MSVYRELFIEVPIALLEAAVIEAQQRKKPEPSRAAKLGIAHPGTWIILFKEVAHAVDWKLIAWRRDAYADYIHVRVRLKCGHIGRFFIDELSVFKRAGSAADLVDFILDKIERGPEQRCQCGKPQGLGPAGKL